MSIDDQQRSICAKYGAPFEPSLPKLKLGIARNFDSTSYPVNGLRHRVEGGTCGWYLWSGGQFSDASDFFVPMHVSHLSERCAEAVKYLGLPPGWRFLIAPDHEDVWYDRSLLQS